MKDTMAGNRQVGQCVAAYRRRKRKAVGDYGVTAAQVAQLRHWLRGRLGSAAGHARRPPPWLSELLPGHPAHIRVHLAAVLDRCVADGLILPEQDRAWRAGARLCGERSTQHDLAHDLGVTTRTVRAWTQRVDQVLAWTLASQASVPATVPQELSDPVEVGVALTQLTQDLLARGGIVEQLEAVRAYAADRLGGTRPRRRGAKRWARKRTYDAIPERLGMIVHQPPMLDLGPTPSRAALLVTPYTLAEDPTTAIAVLERAWAARDRAVLPLLADHTLRLLNCSHDVSIDEQILAMAVIANALRDAENLRAMTFARAWRQLAIRAGGVRDFRAWMAHGVMIHMLEIHGHTRVAAQAQQHHVERFAHLDVPASHDRAWHQQDRYARLISIELAAGLPGGMDRADAAVRAMRTIQDAGAADIDDAHAAVRRRRIEVRLTRLVRDCHGQAIGTDAQLDQLVTELEQVKIMTGAQLSLSEIDLLLRIDIARQDWSALAQHLPCAEQAAGRPDAPPNLVERINERLGRTAHRTPCGGRILRIPHDLFREKYLIPST